MAMAANRTAVPPPERVRRQSSVQAGLTDWGIGETRGSSMDGTASLPCAVADQGLPALPGRAGRAERPLTAILFRSLRASRPEFSFSNGRQDRGEMARGDVRIAVTLACEQCKRRNYQSNKSRRNSPDRIELRKYCRWCGSHTAHKETR